MSPKLGTSTLNVEVSGITANGIWLYAKGREYFLAHQEFPWFRNARIFDIQRVKLLRSRHLYWPNLDVDLELDSLENPAQYPLKYKNKATKRIVYIGDTYYFSKLVEKPEK